MCITLLRRWKDNGNLSFSCNADFQSVVTNLYNRVASLRKEIRELQAEKMGVDEIIRMSQQYKETQKNTKREEQSL